MKSEHVMNRQIVYGFICLGLCGLFVYLLMHRWWGFFYDSPGGYGLHGPYLTRTSCILDAKRTVREEGGKYVKILCGSGSCGDEWDDIHPDCNSMITVYQWKSSEQWYP